MLLFVIHFGVAVWIALGVSFGYGLAYGLFVKITTIYYLLCIFSWEQGRRAQHGSRAIWTVQNQLEREANAERALAHAARETLAAKV